MKKYEKPVAICFNVSSADIITTSQSAGNDSEEPGVELPEMVFPRIK